MSLDSKHLDLLAALRTTESLAAASTAINLSPSAASRRLTDAERVVGVALTTQVGRTVRLTAAGRLLADAARESGRVLAEAELAARWIGADGPPPLQVGVGFFDAISWLLPDQEHLAFEVVETGGRQSGSGQPGTRQLGARQPGARPPGRAGSSRPGPAAVIDVVGASGAPEGTATNTAVATGRQRDPVPAAAARRVLGPDRLVLVVAAGHRLADSGPVGAAGLVHLRYLASAVDPLPGFEFERVFLPSGDCPTDITVIGSFSLLLDLVARGQGVTIQPERALTDRLNHGLCAVPLDRPTPMHWVIDRFDAGADHRIDRFCDLVAERFTATAH
ncbi:MAG: LysR family transcriptional regulator [Actinomycetota bacterium]